MLAATALRLAAVNALAPAAQMTAPMPIWPTIAGRKVYDSRLDPDDAYGDDETETGPVLVVYTEESRAVPYEGGEVIPHDLTIRLMVMASWYQRSSGTVSGPDGDERTIEEVFADDPVEVTDALQEAMLDLLVGQVHRRLTGVDGDDAALLLRSIYQSIEVTDDIPLRDASRTTRFATRTLDYHVRLAPDDWPTSPGEGIAGLPTPLSTVAAALPDDSRGRALCERLAGLVRAPVVLGTPIAGIFGHFNPNGTMPLRDQTTGAITADISLEATPE